MKDLKLNSVEGETIETKWDFRRIAIGVTIFAFLLFLGGLMLFPSSKTSGIKDRKTLGVSSGDAGNEKKEAPGLPTAEDVDRILNNAKKTISQISSENLTSSTAAIQKLITDFESLQGKKDAVGVFCELVCKDQE